MFYTSAGVKVALSLQVVSHVGDLIIKPGCICHYFLPAFKPYSITVLCPVQSILQCLVTEALM